MELAQLPGDGVAVLLHPDLIAPHGLSLKINVTDKMTVQSKLIITVIITAITSEFNLTFFVPNDKFTTECVTDID